MGEGNSFSLFVHTRRDTPARSVWGGGGYPNQVRMGGGYPDQVRIGGTLARSGWRGYPSQVRMGGTLARSGWGVPQPGQDRGVPRPGMDCPLSRDGVHPCPGMGYPPPPPPTRDRTADGVLDTRRAVCLLRSRRRTLLL